MARLLTARALQRADLCMIGEDTTPVAMHHPGGQLVQALARPGNPANLSSRRRDCRKYPWAGQSRQSRTRRGETGSSTQPFRDSIWCRRDPASEIRRPWTRIVFRFNPDGQFQHAVARCLMVRPNREPLEGLPPGGRIGGAVPAAERSATGFSRDWKCRGDRRTVGTFERRRDRFLSRRGDRPPGAQPRSD